MKPSVGSNSYSLAVEFIWGERKRKNRRTFPHKLNSAHVDAHSAPLRGDILSSTCGPSQGIERERRWSSTRSCCTGQQRIIIWPEQLLVDHRLQGLARSASSKSWPGKEQRNYWSRPRTWRLRPWVPVPFFSYILFYLLHIFSGLNFICFIYESRDVKEKENKKRRKTGPWNPFFHLFSLAMNNIRVATRPGE